MSARRVNHHAPDGDRLTTSRKVRHSAMLDLGVDEGTGR